MVGVGFEHMTSWIPPFSPTPLTNFPSFTLCFEMENILMRGVPFEFGSKSQLMINLKFISLSFSSNPNPNSKLGLGQSIKVIFPSFLCYFSCLIHRVSNPYAFLCFSLLLLCVCFCFIFIFFLVFTGTQMLLEMEASFHGGQIMCICLSLIYIHTYPCVDICLR